jgi:hypothetical protein
VNLKLKKEMLALHKNGMNAAEIAIHMDVDSEWLQTNLKKELAKLDIDDEYLIEQTTLETFDIIDAITPALREAVKHLLVQQGVSK